MFSKVTSCWQLDLNLVFSRFVFSPEGTSQNKIQFQLPTRSNLRKQ